MPSIASNSCHINLIGCLDGLWHFGRAVHLDTIFNLRSGRPDAAAPPLQPSHHFLYPLFHRLDKHGDGHVSLHEMRSLLCNQLDHNDVSHACLAALVETATSRSAASDSETFDFTQFTELYESVFKESTEADEEEDLQVVEEAFDVYDRNHDGFISASELATVLTELGLMTASDGAREDIMAAQAVEKCQAFIDRVDSDGNGLVDLQEFKAMLMGNHFPSPISIRS